MNNQEQQLRQLALERAGIDGCSGNGSVQTDTAIVKRAQAYYDFLRGKAVDQPQGGSRALD